MRLIVFSAQDEPLFELAPSKVFGATRVEEINGEHALTIVTSQVLSAGQRILTQEEGTGKWREWVVLSEDAPHASGDRSIGTYYCPWSLQADLVGTYVSRMPGVETPVMASVALDAALSGTERWERGTVTQATSGGASMYQRSGWSALAVLVATWGGEIDADITVGQFGVSSRKVNLSSHLGSSSAVRRFEWTRDLVSIQRKVTMPSIACRVRPLGQGEQTESGGVGRKITIESVNGGIPWLEDAESAQLFRRPSGDGWEYPEVIIENGQISEPQDLKDWALSVMHNHTRPKVSYSASVLQFAQAGMDATGLALGDEVQCIDRGFRDDVELRISGRVVKLVTNELDPSDVSVTIGQISEGMASTLAKLDARVTTTESNVSDLQAVSHTTEEFLDDMLGTLNAKINEAGGWTYLTDGQGIRTYDVQVSDPLIGAEASMVTEVKGGTLRIANSKDGQGNWNWRTVIESGHVAADLITAASITSGYIGSSSGANFWDLDSGELRIANTATIGETTVEELVETVYNANLVPFSSDIQYAHGWVFSNAAGDGNSVTISASSAADWAHYVKTSFMQYSQLRGKTVTLGFTASGTANGNVSVRCELWANGTTRKWQSATFTTATATTTPARFTATLDLDDEIFTMGSGEILDTDLVRFAFYSRTANVTITLSEVKVEYGSEATPWASAPSDSGGLSLDFSLDQDEVFDRLTGGGANQGIYLSNGEVYVNASYIRTGTLSADRVSTYAIKAARMGNSDAQYAIVGSVSVSGQTGTGLIFYDSGSVAYAIVKTSSGLFVAMPDSGGTLWPVITLSGTTSAAAMVEVMAPPANTTGQRFAGISITNGSASVEGLGALMAKAGVKSGQSASASIPAGSYGEFTATFSPAFSSVPHVVCCARTTSALAAHLTAVLYSVTASSAKIRIYNDHTAAISAYAEWIAHV